MATNNLLTQPTPHYHKFVDNQVLTDDQLNSMLDYLNHQDRLSRMLLHGVGIICGMDISLMDSEDEIRLSDGVAVTTAGDLLKPGIQNYRGFKEFKDTNVKYSFFTDEEGESIKLWELEAETTASDVRPLSQFESRTDIDLRKAIALLYLEDYLGEEEDCSPVDCDTQGRPVVNQLRVLLVSEEDARKIAQKDSIISGLLLGGNEPFVGELQKIYVPRVMLNQSNTRSFDQFKEAYTVSFNSLARQMSQIGSLSIFEEVFSGAGIDPVSELHRVAKSALSFQYVYDFYKDLSDSYNVLRDLMKRNYALCCPDPTAFPKHVLLGRLNKRDPKNLRHPYYPSPTHMEIAVSSMKKHLWRILLMIKSFRVEKKDAIRITPSRDDDFALGKRAVPYYYDLEKFSQAAELLQHWKDEDIELIPNYYGMGYPAGNFEPLNVHLDDHDFYRIEGHTGKNILDAHKQIKEIQKGKSLPFDIQQVAIGEFPDEFTIDYDKYRVYFEDLQVILQAWNEEQQCLVKKASDFLTKFSTKDPGTHIAYNPPQMEANPNANDHIEMIDVVHTETKIPVTEKYTYGVTGKRKKARENQVMKSISSEKDTVGYEMMDVITVSDNKNDMWVKTNLAIGDKVNNWDPDILEATVTIPVQLVGYLKETEDYKLTDIEDFTEENLEKYLRSLKAQCRKTSEAKKKIQRLIKKEGSALRSKEWTDNYMYVLNQISSACCIIEKVKVLYEKIIERKTEVLERFVLDSFINDHPGAEHKGGVEKGGTFVLLYYSRSKKPKSSQRLNKLFESMEKAPERGREMFSHLSRATAFEEITHFPGLTEDAVALRRAAEAGLDRPVGFLPGISAAARENLSHGTVVGDLCLPYICCSDTPSASFIFPDQVATLRIAVDHVCVDENGNNEPIALTVTPADGTVTAFVQKRALENVIRVNENGTFLDPNSIPSDVYGNSIRFEVNGQPVDPILNIYRKPEASFTFDENISFREENRIAVVTFKNSSKPFDELTFEWDFNGEIVRNENALEFTHMFKVEPGRNFDFNVKLTAISGACRDTFTDQVTIDVPELERPDEPVEPDEPDQPERNCVQLSTMAIKASVNSIELEIRRHRREIDRQFLNFYLRRIEPMYQQILSDPQTALSGQSDNQILSLISESQKMIIESISTQNTDVQRQFLLMIYYEMTLLYFYINSCRDTVISSDIAIHGRNMNWLSFTEMAFGQFREALKMLLEADKIHSKLEVVEQRMGSRFDRNMRSIVMKMIRVLNEIINGR